MNKDKKIGFIGLGLMGLPMAKNLLKNGFELWVYNRTSSKSEELVSLGAKVAQSPMEMAKEVDTIITMVTAGSDVKEVLFGENGAAKAQKELTVIDMSTIGRIEALEISKHLEEFGIDFLDAPVTGSTPKAISGELTIFIGGKKEVYEANKDVLSAMGTNLIYMGESGSGQAVKLLNNFLIASLNETFSEAMLLADSMDLSREKACEALSQTPNVSPSLIGNMPHYIKEEYPVLFTLKNLTKDLNLAKKEMEESKKSLPTLEEITGLFDEANNDSELTDMNFTAILKYIKSLQ